MKDSFVNCIVRNTYVYRKERKNTLARARINVSESSFSIVCIHQKNMPKMYLIGRRSILILEQSFNQL